MRSNVHSVCSVGRPLYYPALEIGVMIDICDFKW